MSDPSQLFSLVKRLGKGEKRHVKLALTQGAGRRANNYVELYDRMAEMEVYDGKALKASLNSGKLRQNLASTQSRLLRLVLKSLRIQLEGRNAKDQIRIWLRDAEILIDKGMMELAERFVRKAERLALEHEAYALLPQVIEVAQERIRRDVRLADGPARLEVLATKEAAYLERLRLQKALFHLNEQMRALARGQVRLRDATLVESARLRIAQPSMSHPPAPTEFLANIYYHNIYGHYYLATGTPEKAFDNYQSALRKFDDAPAWISRQPDLFLGIVNNYFSICLHVRARHPDFLRRVQQMRSLPTVEPKSRLKIERIAFQQQLMLYMNFGAETSHAAEGFIDEVTNWLQAHSESLPIARRLAFCYNIMMFRFVRSEFKLAYRWLLKIVNMPGREERKDIRDISRIFQPLLQYEMGAPDLPEYLLRSANRHLRRTGRRYRFESLVIRLLRQLLSDGDVQTGPARTGLRSFVTFVDEMLANPDEHRLLGLAELRFWADSKLEGISLRDYYQQQVEARLAAIEA